MGSQKVGTRGSFSIVPAESNKKRVLLFSTLSPYPFWAGSETYWFDFVTDPQTAEHLQFHIRLADSPVTRSKAQELLAAGADVGFYKHFNVEFVRRNVARLRDRLVRSPARTLPWYDEIGRGRWDLVWFNVDGLNNLRDLQYAVSLCKKHNVPYWLILQHAYEDFFLDGDREISIYTDIALSARRFVFIAERNRRALERALSLKITNAFHSKNSLPPARLAKAGEVAELARPRVEGVARFLNLGRFSPKDKGQHLLLEALATKRWDARDWKLSFVGVSDEGASYLHRMADFLGIDRTRIATIGFTEKVIPEIGNHDVLLMPSLAEGTPFAMIEAMACGRPAVGTPIGGIPELIRDGETGWLARSASLIDIEDALERMWADRQRWADIGTDARQWVVTNFNSVDVMKELLERLLLDVGSNAC
jgi:glycosyltransferase involved in cell wall biosynthesis